MITAIKFLILILCILVAYILGYTFTIKYPLATKYDIFKFKIFECRKCLTFHIGWILTTFTSLLFDTYIVMLIFGVIFNLGFFYLMHKDERERFVET